ncbi:unnamed protein product [Miscanthus lutarioriparius]|uniref:Uncharacterized protein n=1 Tax=Miscanthus lutarioriparius TaxID=422564 RepID=A0A811SQN7_9POAL|nr:unnamed protein product [Miscanthus lutarioriparius]
MVRTDVARYRPKSRCCCCSDKAPSISDSMRVRAENHRRARRFTDATATYLQPAVALGPACLCEVAPAFRRRGRWPEIVRPGRHNRTMIVLPRAGVAFFDSEFNGGCKLLDVSLDSNACLEYRPES